MYEVMMFTAAGSQVVEFAPQNVDMMVQFLDVLQARNVTYVAMTDRTVVAFKGGE